MNPIIYTCHHKPGPHLKSNIFQPLHVGRARANNERLREMQFAIGDNTGDHISKDNVTHNELSGLYWVWKNTPQHYDHIGFMHYSRLLNLSGKNRTFEASQINNFSGHVKAKNGWSDSYISELVGKHKVIAPEKWQMHKNHIIADHKRYNNMLSPVKKLEQAPGVLTMYQHFCLGHIEEDLILVLQIMRDYYPQMYHQSWQSLRSTNAYFCNMFIMPRDLVDEYCSMLFHIFEELRNRKDYTSETYTAEGAYNRGFYGFISERIFSIYLDMKRNSINDKRWMECSVTHLTN